VGGWNTEIEGAPAEWGTADAASCGALGVPSGLPAPGDCSVNNWGPSGRAGELSDAAGLPVESEEISTARGCLGERKGPTTPSRSSSSIIFAATEFPMRKLALISRAEHDWVRITRSRAAATRAAMINSGVSSATATVAAGGGFVASGGGIVSPAAAVVSLSGSGTCGSEGSDGGSGRADGGGMTAAASGSTGPETRRGRWPGMMLGEWVGSFHTPASLR